jgi:hypothetical protein
MLYGFGLFGENTKTREDRGRVLNDKLRKNVL